MTAWWRRSHGWQEAAWTVATMILSVIAAAWVLGLTASSIRVPINAAEGDMLMALSAIKGMLENGWYLVNPALGAPVGQEISDFGALNGDNANWVILRLMGFVITDPVVLLNSFFLLGFALAGGVAYLVLRDLGTRRVTSLALAAFYANLSFHFTRGEGHLMLGMYYVAPAAIWLTLRVLTGRPLVRRGEGDGIGSWFTGTNVGTALSVIAIGGSTIYYAFFTLVLLVIATAVRAIATRGWRDLIPGGALIVATGFVLFLNLLPGITYRIANGANPDLAQRIPHESWLYSFDLTRLVFMVAGHRIDRFSNLGNNVAGNSLTVGEGDILGLVLGITFLVMLALVAVWLVRGRGGAGARGSLLNSTLMLAATCFLLGTTGGLGAMFAVILTPQIRAWTRITPFLAFLCLIVLAMGVDWVRRRIDGAGWSRVLSAALPLVVGAFALWDGTSPANRPNHAANITEWRGDQEFVDRITDTLPPGSSVLQLPVQPFPEAGGIVQMGDYEHLTGYVHADGLRWSYGAMKGRPGDWSRVAADLPPGQLVTAAAAAGFSGVWIDRRGYEDQGTGVETAVANATGLTAPTAESPDGNRVFYDLRPLQERVDGALSPAQKTELASALTDPVVVVYGNGFYGPEKNEDERWRWATNDAVMTIRNGTDQPQQVRWTASLRSAIGSTTRISVNGEVLAEAAFPKAGAEPKVSVPITVPPGGIDVRVETTGNDLGPGLGDPRPLYLQVINPLLIDETFAQAETAVAG